MLFVEPRFILFFLFVLLFYWTIKTNLYRKIVLLIASYAFYSAWDYRFLSLIIISTVVNYISALKIYTSNNLRVRQYALFASLSVNLGLLFIFKYFNFFSQSLRAVMNQIGIEIGYNTLNIVLPVGISFFTFQIMSYTIDIYRKNIRARRNILDIAVFIAFFPQLVAGPIVRASEFLPQLDSVRRFAEVPVKASLFLFVIGYFKKAVISDNISPYIDVVFSSPERFSANTIYAAVLLYAAQIYCDFSGYSDMAIAVAGLLGYQLPINFSAPYFSTSVIDFWRRWHISLSTWLRDYLYIPLGGNRKSELNTYRNLMLTMLLGGLWHGASWNFVIWGGLHGVALSINRVIAKLYRHGENSGAFFKLIGCFFTLYWVCFTWIFFRSASLRDAFTMVRIWSFGDSMGIEEISYGYWGYAIPIVILTHWLFYRFDVLGWVESHVAWPFFWFFFGMLVAIVLSLTPMGYKPFVYFQF